ncbi:hypothetical protein PbJCM13498_39360 [Prolixibacter bellariivorans]|uniref:Uncharacterized protein n=1 Tax=Prolixibacter bellariivorans TaxID=314319 RepID=A0A5M4B5D0_9BACT|nr:hypothetical protein [Prolixibacter bellariivorans]GET35073.1 hypothetical protein PbJCM13498_39360 [Prolixibacter bellariivorans]
MEIALIIIGLGAVIGYVASAIFIFDYVNERIHKRKHFGFINLFIFSYVKHYKQLTREEKGKTGRLFYLWILSINVALVCFILFLIFR